LKLASGVLPTPFGKRCTGQQKPGTRRQRTISALDHGDQLATQLRRRRRLTCQQCRSGPLVGDEHAKLSCPGDEHRCLVEGRAGHCKFTGVELSSTKLEEEPGSRKPGAPVYE